MAGLENTTPIQPQVVLDNLRKLPDPEEVQILTAFINLKLKK